MVLFDVAFLSNAESKDIIALNLCLGNQRPAIRVPSRERHRHIDGLTRQAKIVRLTLKDFLSKSKIPRELGKFFFSRHSNDDEKSIWFHVFLDLIRIFSI